MHRHEQTGYYVDMPLSCMRLLLHITAAYMWIFSKSPTRPLISRYFPADINDTKSCYCNSHWPVYMNSMISLRNLYVINVTLTITSIYYSEKCKRKFT